MASEMAACAVFCAAFCASQNSAWPRTRGLLSLCAARNYRVSASGSLLCVSAKMACSRILSFGSSRRIRLTISNPRLPLRIAQPENRLTPYLLGLGGAGELFQRLIGGRVRVQCDGGYAPFARRVRACCRILRDA